MTIMAVTVLIVSTILYNASTSSYHNTAMLLHVSEHLDSQMNMNLSLRRSYGSADFGYVVALRYTGQQGTGIQALMSLQCFIGSLNLSMYILEPSMTRTSFGSSFEWSQIHNSSSLKFGDMFDVTHFNRASRTMGFAEIRSESEFQMNGPTDVILVESFRSVESPATLVWTSKEKNDCYSDQRVPNSYCIRRVVSVTGKKDIKVSYRIFTEEELFSVVLGPWSPKDITLVFREWHTPWYVSSRSLSNPSQCKDIRSISTEIQFHTSSTLLADAQRYEDHFLGSAKNKLAIMFRIERMMIYLTILKNRKKIDNIETSVTKCLNKVVNVAEERRKKNGFSIPLVTLDLGNYGSISWRDRNVEVAHNITKQAKSTLSNLFHNQWTFSEWEDSFSQVVTVPGNSGYIAALQRTLASRADCLVLVGGGYFQELALNDYKRSHPDKSTWCIYVVCAINFERLQKDADSILVDVYRI